MSYRLVLASIVCVAAPALAEYDDVTSCLAATEAHLARDPAYDRFVRSGGSADAAILRWEEAFSGTDPHIVATLVEIDGRARRRAGPTDTWDEAKARCGLNDAKVERVEIVPAEGREG